MPVQREPGPSGAAEELLFFPSGRLLEPMCLGYNTLAADVCWLRAIQYYGQHHLTDGVYTGADHIFDVIARLDPEFQSAYIFGASGLAQDAHPESGACALLHRGMASLPTAWELPFEAGFLEYVTCRRPDLAEPYFHRAAAYADAPDMARRFAAFSAQKSGDTREAEILWRDIAEHAESAALRGTAERYLAKLHAAGQS